MTNADTNYRESYTTKNARIRTGDKYTLAAPARKIRAAGIKCTIRNGGLWVAFDQQSAAYSAIKTAPAANMSLEDLHEAWKRGELRGMGLDGFFRS
jgi:hypothetical protein